MVHCRAVQYEDGTVTVEDLGTTNGTWIGPDKLGADPVLLEPGDVLRIGRTVLPWITPR